MANQYRNWLEVNVYSRLDLGDENVAFRLLEAVTEAGLVVEKLGETEPFQHDYSSEALRACLGAIRKRSSPCGGLGFSGKPWHSGLISWCHPRVARRTNHISIVIDAGDAHLAEGLLKSIGLRLDAEYGYADAWLEVNRQGGRGVDLRLQLPGIFWMNWFGRDFVEHIGSQRVSTAPWSNVARINDAVLAQATTEPNSPVTKANASAIENLKLSLGIGTFTGGGASSLPAI